MSIGPLTMLTAEGAVKGLKDASKRDIFTALGQRAA